MYLLRILVEREMRTTRTDSSDVDNMLSILVAIVLDMSRKRPGLVPTFPFLGQCPVFMGTQERLQNISHGSVTCPLCPATRLWVKEQK